MSLSAMAGEDLRAIIAQDPVTFTFEGEEYVGTRSGLNLRQPLEIGGFQDEPEMTLVISIYRQDGSRTIEDLPNVNQKLTIGSTVYRIERTERDAEGVGYQMDLRSANK